MIPYHIDMYCISTCIGTETQTFRTSLNTGCIDHVLAVSADFGRSTGIPAGIEKSLFLL